MAETNKWRKFMGLKVNTSSDIENKGSHVWAGVVFVDFHINSHWYKSTEGDLKSEATSETRGMTRGYNKLPTGGSTKLRAVLAA